MLRAVQSVQEQSYIEVHHIDAKVFYRYIFIHAMMKKHLKRANKLNC